MHGNITSMSYNIPHVGFGSVKVDEYLKTWAGGIQKNGLQNIDKLSEVSQQVYNQPIESYKKANEKHKELAYINLENLSNKIKNFEN